MSPRESVKETIPFGTFGGTLNHNLAEWITLQNIFGCSSIYKNISRMDIYPFYDEYEAAWKLETFPTLIGGGNFEIAILHLA